jgi:hypothetical protein
MNSWRRTRRSFVTESRFVVVEEDSGDEVAAAVDAGFVEDALQVLLHGVRRDVQLLRDVRR